jgi:uncharacterized membrane protein YbaN (DUF454 family)
MLVNIVYIIVGALSLVLAILKTVLNDGRCV